MNNRQRFENTMAYVPVDHPPIILDLPWPRTRDRWREAGFPDGVSMCEYFDVEPFDIVKVGPEVRVHPGYKNTILEKKDGYTTFIDSRGIKCRCHADYEEGIQYLDYPIKGSADKGWLADRLDPDDPTRWAEGWEQRLAALEPDSALGTLEFGSFFGDLHERMGTEAISLAFFDDPDFVHWYNDRIASCAERAITRLLPDARIAFMSGHEDMAFKNGPFVSPAMFREFLMPYYRRTVGAARERGQTLFFQDSDGNIEQLIPLWFEVGVNMMSPMEVAAGMDPVRLRSKFGKDLLMVGGIDKRALISGKEAIRREVLGKESLIHEGGYIPRLDHTIAPDISLEHYTHYVELLKSVYGMS